MLLRSLCALLLIPALVFAQEESKLEIDFLSGYYDQDGENSPVNGGIGSEELTSASPIVVVRYQMDNGWKLTANLGVDNITSASIDSMDDNRTNPIKRDDDAYEEDGQVSSASRMDNRAFATFSAAKKFGNHTWSFQSGFSKEYDYLSVNGGLSWNMDFNANNSSIGLSLHRYQDTLDHYNIDGINIGDEDRETTDLTFTFSQLLTKKSVIFGEVFHSQQDGFLSSPFQEVILTDGTHVAERLPDSRSRSGFRLGLNNAFTQRIIGRWSYRYYTDDWGIDAHSIELEPHFRLPTKRETWIYPILRTHSQSSSDYFGLPQTFEPSASFYTADRDLSEFTADKFGVGMRTTLNGKRLKRLDFRATSYSRDDGLDAFSISFGLGWSW